MKKSSPRLILVLEKQGSKVLSLKWLRKRPKFRGIPRLVLEKAKEKGKIPRLVLDLGKILAKVLSSTLSSPDDPSRTSATASLLVPNAFIEVLDPPFPLDSYLLRMTLKSYNSIKLLTKNTTHPLSRFYAETMQRRPQHPIIILFPYKIGII